MTTPNWSLAFRSQHLTVGCGQTLPLHRILLLHAVRNRAARRRTDAQHAIPAEALTAAIRASDAAKAARVLKSLPEVKATLRRGDAGDAGRRPAERPQTH